MSSGEDWTLEGELKKLGESDDVASALVRLKLLETPADEFSLVAGEEGWVRGGSETYIFRFAVERPGATLPLVLKACVAFAPASSLQSILQEWVSRRHLLQEQGASTPVLYYWGQGVVLEEEVPYLFHDALVSRQGKAADALILQAAELAGIVRGSGFSPVRLFDDLRSRGDDVVIIDFGEDLGPAHVTDHGNGRLLDQLLDTLRGWRKEPDGALLSQMRTVYDQAKSLRKN